MQQSYTKEGNIDVYIEYYKKKLVHNEHLLIYCILRILFGCYQC